MKDISFYLDPFDPTDLKTKVSDHTLFSKIHIYNKQVMPDLNGYEIAILGVCEGRNSKGNDGCKAGSDVIREELYELCYDGEMNVLDLGNIKAGNTVDDTIHGLSDVISHLLNNQCLPIILGGPQYLTYAMYLSYVKIEKMINLVSIDSRLDVEAKQGDLSSTNYLNKIILQEPNFLFNFIQLAYQSYLVPEHIKDLLEKMYFELRRLGELNQSMQEIEPLIRQGDMLSFDVNSIRHSDFPAHTHALPNGLYGEQACQIMRYAGMNDNLTSLGIFEYNPVLDNRKQSAKLIAQMIWYFFDGYYNRKKELPSYHLRNFMKYKVSIQDHHELTFYKSKQTDRWWMEVPYPADQERNLKRSQIVPCSYDDYQLACQQEMPDRWWKTYQRLS